MLRRAASGQWLTCINERGDASWTFIHVLGKHLLLWQKQSTNNVLIATPFALWMVFPCVLPNAQNWRATSVVHSRTDPTNGCLPSASVSSLKCRLRFLTMTPNFNVISPKGGKGSACLTMRQDVVVFYSLASLFFEKIQQAAAATRK